MAAEIVANLLAGLGLFFIGVKFIGDNMKQMAGRSLRRLVGYLTLHPFFSAVSGVVAGALVQSANAVTFIMTSLISSRLITVRKAMPIIVWANVGNSLIVLLAVLDLRLAALYLLGTIGFCYYLNLDRSNRFRHAVGALLGLGLLLLGLIFMKEGADPLKKVEWLTRFLAYTKTSYALAFLSAGFLTFIVQSSTTVSVIAIAMAKVGLLGVEQTVMIIYGSNLGSGVSTWFMSANLKGMARQVAIFQTLFKVVGVAVLVPLFYAEIYLHLPALESIVSHLAGDFGRQMAYLFLLFQLCAAALVLPWTGRILRLLEWISPATVEEELSRPQYIYEQALDEPETALELAEKESLRLVRHLPDFLDDLREDTSSKPALGAATFRKAVVEVGGEVRLFVTDLIDAHQSRELLEQALNLQNRVDIVGSLAETLAEFVALSHQAREMSKLAAFSGRMAEALHLILTTGYETAENPDLENCGVLLQLTADRGEMMAQIRRGFLGERNLEPTEHQNLMTLTTLFERMVWLLRRYGTLLESQATTSSR